MAGVKDVRQHMNKVTMELGDKERTLQFDMNAFAELENRFGSIDAAMEQLMSGKIGDVRTILWAALIHDEVAAFDEDSGEPISYNITPYQVGSWVRNPAMLQEVSTKLAEVMSFDMPDPEHLPEEVKQELANRGITIPEATKKEEEEVKNG